VYANIFVVMIKKESDLDIIILNNLTL